MPKASELDASKYGILFASAGHAALIDYPHATSLQKIGEEIWSNGGILASVCHGPALFSNLIDRATGEPVIKGKKITGFTTEGEYTMKIMDELRSWNAELVEELAQRLGATYERPAGIWDDFHLVDGRLVTGVNPASATSTAQAVVEAFKRLQ
ncbi:putative DJ-1/PfpI domain-containing protein [Seiridium cardinale]